MTLSEPGGLSEGAGDMGVERVGCAQPVFFVCGYFANSELQLDAPTFYKNSEMSAANPGNF